MTTWSRDLLTMVSDISVGFQILPQRVFPFESEPVRSDSLVLVPIGFQEKSGALRVPVGDLDDLNWLPAATLLVILNGIWLVLSSVVKIFGKAKRKTPKIKET